MIAGVDKIPDLTLPPELRAQRRWVCWSPPDKMPRQPNGRPASSTDPRTWSDLEQCLRAGGGVGFVLGGGLVGIDLDHVRDPATGTLSPEASAIVAHMACYAEVSPSGTGLHLLFFGKKPTTAKSKKAIDGNGHVEIYDHSRYFTVTGQPHNGSSRNLENRQAQLDKLCEVLWPAEPLQAAQSSSAVVDLSVIKRARAYVNHYPPAISGQRGHDVTFRLACKLYWGFALDEGTTLELLHDYNERCLPPWSEAELKHKAESAARQTDDPESRARGYMLRSADAITPFSVRTLEDRPPEPTSWIVHGVLATGVCALVAAQQKSGKTWLTFELALCLATGKPFFGAPVARTGRTLLYTPESGWEARRRRLWGLCWGLGVDPQEVLRSLLLIEERANLTSHEHGQRLAATIREHDPLLVVVDPFVAAAGGIDENSAGEVQEVLDRLRDSLSGDASLILCHHHNKAGNGSVAGAVRGSSAFGGWWDTLISIRREDQDIWSSARRVDIEHRDDPAPEPWGFEIATMTHPGSEVPAFKLSPTKAPKLINGRGNHNQAAAEARKQDVLRLVSVRGGLTVGELAQDLEVTERSIRTYLARLERDGRIRREGNNVLAK